MSDTTELVPAVNVALVLKQAAETNRQLMAAIAQLEAPARLGQAVMESSECYGFAEAAKLLSPKLKELTGVEIGQNRLFDFCRITGILIRDGAHRNEPYQEFLHHFKLVLKDTAGGPKTVPLFTGKGLEWILKRLVAYYS